MVLVIGLDGAQCIDGGVKGALVERSNPLMMNGQPPGISHTPCAAVHGARLPGFAWLNPHAELVERLEAHCRIGRLPGLAYGLPRRPEDTEARNAEKKYGRGQKELDEIRSLPRALFVHGLPEFFFTSVRCRHAPAAHGRRFRARAGRRPQFRRATGARSGSTGSTGSSVSQDSVGYRQNGRSSSAALARSERLS